jgi:hypothetical protein
MFKYKYFTKNSNTQRILTKLTNKNFASFMDDDDVDTKVRFNDARQKDHIEELKRKEREEQENMLRRAHEFAKKRQDDVKKTNKEFLLKMNVPGVKESKEK